MPLSPVLKKYEIETEEAQPFAFKDIYASMETSRDISGDYVQFEESTFDDLKDRGKIRKDIKFKGLVESGNYDEVAGAYHEDLKTTFKIPTDEEAALWSWRPGWYEKYSGKIENIPDDLMVTIDDKKVKAKDVMYSRQKNFNAYKQNVIEDKDIPERQPTESELAYFKNNPNVGGMATKDNSITINPFSSLNEEQKNAVRTNERARVYMHKHNIKPSFDITPEQQKQFANYGSPQDIRETIVGRIISGDPSAGNITSEQKQFVDTLQTSKKPPKSPLKDITSNALKTSLSSVARSFIPGGVMPTKEGMEHTKSVIRGMRDVAIASPQAFGSLVQEMGERAEELPDLTPGSPDAMISQALPMYPIMKTAKGLAFRTTDIDEDTVQLGKQIVEKNKQWIDENIPDYGPEGKNKLKDMLYHLGSGVTTLGAALGVSAITKSPHAASILFGVYQKGQIYQLARDKGLDPRAAGQLSTLAGGIEGALEYIGLEYLLSPTRGSKIFSALIKTATEATQEFSQQVGENLVVKMGGIDKARPVFQGAGTSALVGAILGGTAGVAIDTAREAGMLDDIKSSTGLSTEKASQLLEKVVTEQYNKVKEVLTDEAGFARIGKEGEPPIEPEKVPPVAPEVAKEPITELLIAFEGIVGEDFVAYTATPEFKKAYRERPEIKQAINEITEQAKIVKEETAALKDIKKGAAESIKKQERIKKAQDKMIEKTEKLLSKEFPKGKVKPLIHKVTGFNKTIDSIVTNEMALLKTQLRAEAKGAKIGEVVGKREIRTEEAIKRKVTGLTDSLKSMGQRKLPVEYKDQVDNVLEQYDLKKRTEKTKAKRIDMTEFIDTMREQGDLAFVPKDFFKDYGVKTTLDEMTLEDLENLHNQVKVLVTAGSNEGKLIAGEKELDLETTINDMTKTIYSRRKMAEPTEEELRYKPPSEREKAKGKYRIQRIIRRKLDAISKYFSGHRKIENLTKVLDIWDEVWMPMQRGSNTELKKGGEMSAKFKEIFAPIAKESPRMMTDTIQVEGMQDPITRWEAIGVALNSENIGNVERLFNGNQYTMEQIKAIKNELNPKETKFVNDIFELIDSYWSDTEANTIKAVGVRPRKIETGKYFPIKTDYSQDIDAQLREAQKNVMLDVFSKAFLEKGFTKPRVGGRGAVDLNVLPVILKHLQDVIHYNAYVLPMRDVQKIIHHPKFKKAIIDTMGEATYSEFKPWLANTVNPKTLSPQNIYETAASMLRKNSTAAILGWKVSVSLLQAGSFLQTVKAIGMKSALEGVGDFYFGRGGPIASTEWVYSKSEEIKNRSSLWDRELKDWMESKQAKQLLKGLPEDAKSTLFVMIRSVDFITVMPTWIGTYNKEMSQHGNEQQAIDEADSTVRITQPMGSIKDLPRMLRGTPYQKFFTMFKSFYTTMHNQMVDIKDEYKFSDDPVIGKTGKAALGYFWVWIAPSLLATWIRSGFKEKDPKEYAKGLVTFPLMGLFLISDLVSSMASGFKMGVPALKAFEEFYYGVKGKKPYTKTKHFVKSIGTFLGKPVDSLWTFGEGMGDLISGKTTDPRRLVYSKYALKEKESKPTSAILDKYGIKELTSKKESILKKYGIE